MTNKKAGPSPLFRRLARWHQWAGLGGAAFIVMLVVTGVLINHSAQFAFEKRKVATGWMLDWYGIGAPIVENGFHVGKNWIVQAEKRLYLDQRQIGRSEAEVVGAVQVGNEMAVATTDHLMILDAQGNPLEQLGHEHGLPGEIMQIGKRGSYLAVRSRDGDYRAEIDVLHWEKKTGTGADWSRSEALPEDIGRQIAADARSKTLSVDRVLRDIHTGRILGAWGMLFADALAFVLLALTITGVWVWWRARKEFPGRKKQK